MKEPATVLSAAVGGLREETFDRLLSSRAPGLEDFAPAPPWKHHRRERGANTDSSGWGDAPLEVHTETKP
jgi:hypothetical protein